LRKIGGEFYELLDAAGRQTSGPQLVLPDAPRPKDSHYEPHNYGQNLSFEQIPLGHIVILDQIRDRPNPRQRDLEESMRERLINPPNVARYTERERFEASVHHFNGVWGTNYQVDELPRRRDGSWTELMAGFSRTLGMIASEQERERLSLPNPEGRTWRDASSLFQIHTNPTPGEIVQIQVAENIHSNVAEEREMVSIVYTYLLGLKEGFWSSESEFLREHKTIPRDRLDNAILLTKLPESIRRHVIVESIDITTAVQIALSLPLLVNKYFVEIFGPSADPESVGKEGLATVMTLTESWARNEIVAHKLKNISRKRRIQRFEAYRKDWESAIKRAYSGGPRVDEISMFEDGGLNSGETSEQRRARTIAEKLESQYRTLLKQLAERPLQTYLRAIDTHNELADTLCGQDRAVVEQRRHEIELAAEAVVSAMQSPAMQTLLERIGDESYRQQALELGVSTLRLVGAQRAASHQRAAARATPSAPTDNPLF
jgi:hypothetical protein